MENYMQHYVLCISELTSKPKQVSISFCASFLASALISVFNSDFFCWSSRREGSETKQVPSIGPAQQYLVFGNLDLVTDNNIHHFLYIIVSQIFITLNRFGLEFRV